MLKQIVSQLQLILNQTQGAKDLAVLIFAAAIGILSFLFGAAVSSLKNKASLLKRISNERADAVKKSRAVLGGLAGEQLAPYLPGFPCNPADARFVGKPIDFVAFSGAADGGEIKEIIFVEVKSGEASLSKREREIKSCVEKGRVRYVEYRVP